MKLAGVLLVAGCSLLALPAAQGVCPPADNVMISGWFEFGRQCIGISHRIRMGFQEATMFCSRYGTGGSLYALDSPHKNRVMLSYLTTVFGQGRRQKFWTGYYKGLNALGWRWTSGSTSKYTDWEPGKPSTTNEAIGAVAWGGTYYWQHTWQDEPLSASFAFICQTPAMQANGQPYPGPTLPPATTPAPAPGPGAGPGPNAPGQPGPGPANPGPAAPGAGPSNPAGGAPQTPGTGTPTKPNAPINPRTPRLMQRPPRLMQLIRGYPLHVQHLLAVP